MTDSNRSDTGYNDPKTGRFLPGNKGKPKGARTKFSQQTLAEIVSLKDDAVQVLRNRLAANDGDAARWILERIIGKNARFVEISGTTPDAISQDLMDGALTVDETKDISLAISRLAQVDRMAELEEKFAQLEKLLRDECIEL